MTHGGIGFIPTGLRLPWTRTTLSHSEWSAHAAARRECAFHSCHRATSIMLLRCRCMTAVHVVQLVQVQRSRTQQWSFEKDMCSNINRRRSRSLEFPASYPLQRVNGPCVDQFAGNRSSFVGSFSGNVEREKNVLEEMRMSRAVKETAVAPRIVGFHLLPSKGSFCRENEPSMHHPIAL